MQKKELQVYAVAIAASIVAAFLAPKLIEWVSACLVAQIRQEPIIETEMESENIHEKMSVSMAGQEKEEKKTMDPHTQQGDEINVFPREAENMEVETADLIDDYEKELEAYRKQQDPVILETQKGAADVFVANRKNEFVSAVSDHIFSLYGGSLTITGVDLIEQVKDTEEELVYQIEVFVADGEKKYSELFLSVYNKEWDFYSIYSYQTK